MEIYGKYGVQQKFYERFPIKEATEDSTEKTCAICLVNYKAGNKVFFLPCTHHFHIECIMPWFEKNHHCPNCRFDLNEGQTKEEDDDIDI